MNAFNAINLFANLALTMSTLFIPLFAEELQASRFEVCLNVTS